MTVSGAIQGKRSYKLNKRERDMEFFVRFLYKMQA